MDNITNKLILISTSLINEHLKCKRLDEIIEKSKREKYSLDTCGISEVIGDLILNENCPTRIKTLNQLLQYLSSHRNFCARRDLAFFVLEIYAERRLNNCLLTQVRNAQEKFIPLSQDPSINDPIYFMCLLSCGEYTGNYAKRLRRILETCESISKEQEIILQFTKKFENEFEEDIIDKAIDIFIDLKFGCKKLNQDCVVFLKSLSEIGSSINDFVNNHKEDSEKLVNNIANHVLDIVNFTASIAVRGLKDVVLNKIKSDKERNENKCPEQEDQEEQEEKEKNEKQCNELNIDHRDHRDHINSELSEDCQNSNEYKDWNKFINHRECSSPRSSSPKSSSRSQSPRSSSPKHKSADPCECDFDRNIDEILRNEEERKKRLQDILNRHRK